MNLLGYNWPDTGRKIPLGAVTDIHYIHSNWVDLVYLDKDVWVYVSSLPLARLTKK